MYPLDSCIKSTQRTGTFQRTARIENVTIARCIRPRRGFPLCVHKSLRSVRLVRHRNSPLDLMPFFEYWYHGSPDVD